MEKREARLEAIRLLLEAGWDRGRIALAFGISAQMIERAKQLAPSERDAALPRAALQ
jgi:hypothetical protein